jgi:hypothetical protein
MTNPLVHALVFGAAVIIPGGLVVYFAWRAYSRRMLRMAARSKITAAQEDFKRHFPVESDSSLARERLKRLRMHMTRPRNKSPE